jgi:hypothetical protein
MPDENSSTSFEVDLSNLQLADDEPIEGLDVDAEFSAPLRPIDDGEHQMRLSISERKPKVQGTTKNGRTDYFVFVSGEAIEPGSPNDKKFADDIVSTRVMESGACKAVDFLVKAGHVDKSEIRSMSKGKLIARVYEILQGSPLAKVETRWEARAGGQAKPILKGQRRFPKDANGHPMPLREHPETGEEVYTRAQIVRYVG